MEDLSEPTRPVPDSGLAICHALRQAVHDQPKLNLSSWHSTTSWLGEEKWQGYTQTLYVLDGKGDKVAQFRHIGGRGGDIFELYFFLSPGKSNDFYSSQLGFSLSSLEIGRAYIVTAGLTPPMAHQVLSCPNLCWKQLLQQVNLTLGGALGSIVKQEDETDKRHIRKTFASLKCFREVKTLLGLQSAAL